jgi:riboflavin kinase / FMN adenylyltransferase
MDDFRIFRSLDDVPADFGPSALTIGNFDGLHAGHRRIVKRVVGIASENGWKPSALTFSPHPTRVVAPRKSPLLLTTTEQRAQLMREAGIRQVLILPFTAEVARLRPEEFAARILRDRLGARAILVGENFRFGAQQSGDVETLAELGREYGFITEIVPGLKRHGAMVSSSGVRSLLQEGRVGMAWRFLERPYAIEGAIVSGHGIGSKQTVPTLNLATGAELVPRRGVYVTRTCDLDTARTWDSITNIGMRPTFDGDALTIETYLLSPFDGSTPERIRLAFLYRVRDERKFDSPAELRAQILRDVDRARRFLERVRRCVPSC